MSLIIPRNFKNSELDSRNSRAADSRATDACEDSAEELKSANGKVLKVGSLVVPMSFTDKENKRHLSRVVLKIIPKGKSEFGPYVFLKGGIAPYKPNDLYAFDGCEDSAQFKIGDKVRRGKQTGIVRGIEKEPYIEVKFTDQPVTVFVHESEIVAADSRAADACEDSAEFHVGQRVRAKDPAYEYSDGKALGAGMFTVKEVRNNGDVRLDDDGDVWISPSSLVEANDAI